ncbi:class I SAM-dependent methyltransferase [Planctomonas sp. JC2975]|uniref:class I SAM-dependent methyltransferase n=1 Tax=Planctomonas sp. JC2975 TaxID=2729626 RepID=UPI0014734C17|nr:class I SAM-dependent methyltransferase [Planctomonas sp. JC2975]NNC11236.1 class I SAM-dependent methyltransferase [Planctomonas sp. JC2975]
MRSREEKLEHARSFGSVADVYEASRPEYPADAVAWLVRPEQRHVVDVGAGTGKLTRALVAEGREILAVDPSEEMLRVLRSTVSGVETLIGTGERMPLPDESVDAVTFAQAWHWVDPPVASREVGRVLKPGGTLGLIWNFRDERVDWVRKLGVAMHADGDQFTEGMDDDPHVHAPFGQPERASFGWTQPFDRDGILDLVRSRSYFAVMNAAQQEETLAAVGDLLDTHPQIAGHEVIELPYMTLAFRYVRP